MHERILVVNPNSSKRVTEALSAALEPLRLPGGPAIECTTLDAGPPAIETAADVASVVEPLCELVETTPADAFVIACYSDPGLAPARARSHNPVFGMAESGMLTAVARGRRFGVISILPEAVERHLAYVRALGLESRLAGDLAVGLGVLELADESRAWPRLRATGERLRDHHAADVIVLGCAGMAPYRSRLAAALGVPVVEPTQAAVSMAMGAVLAARAGAQESAPPPRPPGGSAALSAATPK